MVPIFRVLAIFAFLASTSSAASCTLVPTDIMSGEMGPYIAIALFFSILIIILTYLIGIVTNNANFLVFYKDELYHLFFSAIILVIIFGIMNLSCNVLSYFLESTLERFPEAVATGCYPLGSTQDIAQCFMRRIDSASKDMVGELIRKSIREEMDSSFTFTIYTPITGGTTLPFGAYRRTDSMLLDFVAMSFVMPAYISISLQKIILAAFRDFVAWLLPIAVFLRILAPTRQMGNILIGVSVALYVLVPVFYALSGAMSAVLFSETECSRFSAMVSDPVFGDCSSPISFWRVAGIIPQAFFLPNLTLALLITFISSVNKALKVIT